MIKKSLFAVSAALLASVSAASIADDILAKMTLEEKVSILAGDGTMTLRAIPRVGINAKWQMSDNSQSVRRELERWDFNYQADTKIGTDLSTSSPGHTCRATVLPTLSALASTWNTDLARQHGEVLGSEMRARGKDMALGPGLNIMRNPLCGRNWEYMSEDPCLTAKMAVPLVKGIQKFDVAACMKHFCLNDQELNRNFVDTWVDERTLREIYLPAYEACVKEAKVMSVMNAYNSFRGLSCAENWYLQRQILRGEWGFNGVIVTDWGRIRNPIREAFAGTDIDMADGRSIKNYVNAKWLFDAGIDAQFERGEKPVVERGMMPLRDAVIDGLIPESLVDELALHVLKVMEKVGFIGGRKRAKGELNTRKHQEIACRIGEEAITLLKNDEGVLPLDKSKMKRILLVGSMVDQKHCKGGWSAEGNPPYEITSYDGLQEFLGQYVELVKAPLDVKLDRAEAEKADAVLVFTGSTTGHGRARECEGGDRPNMLLPEGDDEAIARILSWGIRNTVVINHSGSPMEMPWVDNCRALVQEPFLGQEAGRPLARVLFGVVNPSGRLPCTWPRHFADTPIAIAGSYNSSNVVYNERFYVGYRWYDKKGIKPMFPFGFGLSYTTFEYGEITVAPIGNSNCWEILVPVKNTGTCAGAEVVQVYLGYPGAKVERCVRDLRGFDKIFLKPGETGMARIVIRERDLAYYDEGSHSFVAPAGNYSVIVPGGSLGKPRFARITK